MESAPKDEHDIKSLRKLSDILRTTTMYRRYYPTAAYTFIEE